MFQISLFIPIFLYSDAPYVGLYMGMNFRGEKEFCQRVKIASERLGWKTEEYNASKSNEPFDWILSFVPGQEGEARKKSYLMLFDPEHHYFNKSGHLSKSYYGFAGYLTTYENTQSLIRDLKGDSNRVYPRGWFATVQYVPYRQVEPKALFYFICHWGNRLKDQKYILLQNLLAEKPYARLYGSPNVGSRYGSAFQGTIPFDGESVIQKISDAGVCLVLHSDSHNKHKIPSGRIFEAASASAVIISDRNPFVVKTFKDTVLYVDEQLKGNELFRQIDNHMKWIQEHPEKALEMAKQAHEIFEKQFLLEEQLLGLYEFIESCRE